MKKTALTVAVVAFAMLAPVAGAKKPPPGTGTVIPMRRTSAGKVVLVPGRIRRNDLQERRQMCQLRGARRDLATGLVLPAGKTATLSSAQFGDLLLPTAPLAPDTVTNCPGICSPTATS